MPQKQSTKSRVSTDHRFKITDQTQELSNGKTIVAGSAGFTELHRIWHKLEENLPPTNTAPRSLLRGVAVQFVSHKQKEPQKVR